MEIRDLKLEIEKLEQEIYWVVKPKFDDFQQKSNVTIKSIHISLIELYKLNCKSSEVSEVKIEVEI